MSLVSEHGANNFATIRTTSIVTKQQKEHNQVSFLSVSQDQWFHHYTCVQASNSSYIRPFAAVEVRHRDTQMYTKRIDIKSWWLVLN